MTKFLLRFAAFLLPLTMLAAPAAAQLLIVPHPNGGEEQMVLAVMATGSEADKVRFEDGAKALGYKPSRSKNNAGEDEVMVVIQPKADRAAFLSFYADARRGKYGKLAFDVILTPLSAIKEDRKFLDEARVFSADDVPLPAE